MALATSEVVAQLATGASEDPAFRAVLAATHERTGADLRQYRAPTLVRRVRNRMISVGARDFGEYLERLRADEAEAWALLGRVTIKVSRFYRNVIVFDALRDCVLPTLARLRGRAPLEIWSAGCGCGEEPYTLAMLLEDAGIPGTIRATDIDPAALEAAARGRYRAAALDELPAILSERFLEADGDEFVVAAAVRARVRFARHDLTATAPREARFDLVCCRNVLIYLEPEVQLRALQSLHRAVAPNGYLCLGEAEWPPAPVADVLEALPHKTRIFRAVDGVCRSGS